MGNVSPLRVAVGQSIEEALVSNGVPPASVIVLADDQIVHDEHKTLPDVYYEARLIEGYDIEVIRNLYRSNLGGGTSSFYIKRLFSVSKDGDIIRHEEDITQQVQLVSLIENLVFDTIQTYSLVDQDDDILVGLSGGVDSSALLTILSEIRKRSHEFNLVAATFEDFDSKLSSAFHHAKELATKLGIEHYIINAEIIEEIFNLRKPLQEILTALMKTNYSHFVMYIDHHTTRRALEYFAEENSIKKITLGLHTSDLLGGWINSLITGYNMGSLPMRTIGNISYIYPLMFISKKELHMYYFAKYGEFIKQTHPNPWEIHPKDRNFYYYLADFLQYYWPGVEYWVLNKYTKNDFEDFKYTKCSNCGAYILAQSKQERLDSDLCDVCRVLSKTGYLR